MTPVNRRRSLKSSRNIPPPPPPPLSPSSHQSQANPINSTLENQFVKKNPADPARPLLQCTHTQLTGGDVYPNINVGNMTISVLLGEKRVHTGVRYIPAQRKDCQKPTGMVTVHSRLVKVRRVKRLRVSSHVSVEHVAVVQSVRLPRLLVLGKVPASSQFGFQSLEVDNQIHGVTSSQKCMHDAPSARRHDGS